MSVSSKVLLEQRKYMKTQEHEVDIPVNVFAIFINIFFMSC